MNISRQEETDYEFDEGGKDKTLSLKQTISEQDKIGCTKRKRNCKDLRTSVYLICHFTKDYALGYSL